ncbi:phosphotransacetylase family protein, partial [Rhodococcus sp. EPR-147]
MAEPSGTDASDMYPSSIYIASPEGDTGKSTIALGVLQMLAASAARVGVFRPIARSTEEPDYILELLVEHTTADLTYEQSLGVTYEQVHADQDAALSEIVNRYHEVASQCDAVVIVGSDYTDVGSPSELGFNARIAVNLGAPVLLALRGSGRTPDEIAQLATLCQGELRQHHAHLAAIVANRCAPEDLDAVTDALASVGVPAWSLPEIPLLVAPTMAELLEAVDGTLYSGDSSLLQREALRVMVGGMTAEHILERLTEGVVVIAPADRSDVLLALVNAHEAEGFPSLAGIIMNGGIEPHPAIARLVAGLGPRLPILTT